ncbi:conserved membrane hypothetical protein [Nostocoides japonicum T1-X7]|uniref:DUF202 domain-containing protein n=1 Tax=Nostocoides japonicum T1-X7 TaxID=1194083 RepID=A0A077LYK4_9MICO|nr:DUF202 domain-containing protein [Tetrasphaera japonica]CCH78993.1 conserved membrane hypothetical protein [Tetrasphaera japonica T1-X7]
MSSPPRRPRAPDDQAERTHLAWTRSLTGLTACSAILVRWLARDVPVVAPLLVITLGAVVAIAVTQRRRIRRQLQGLRDGVIAPDVWGCLSLTAALVLLGVGGVAVLFLSPW